MRGLRVCAGILPPQARARTCTPNSAKARLVHSPVHIPEQERLSRGTGLWSRTLPSPRHGRRGQFVTYPHCEINCGGGIGACRDVSGRVVAVDAHQHRQLAVTLRRETVRVGDRCRLDPVTRRRRHGPFTGRPCRSRCCQRRCAAFELFDLVEHRALTRVDARLASLDQIGLATLEKLPLPGRDRLLRRLATPSGLGPPRSPRRSDCENKPILVFNRENRRTCHGPLPSRGARH